MIWPILLVIARVLADGDSFAPDLEDRAVILMKRHNVTVGCGQDGGMTDAGLDGMPGDAMADAMPDAPPDAPTLDAGVPGDAGMSPDAGACTVIDGDAITMIVEPQLGSAAAGGAHFAMLFVTPSRPIVEVKPHAFSMLDAVTAPQTVTTEVEVEDSSLGEQCEDYGCESSSQSQDGCEGGSTWTPPTFDDNDDRTDGGVTVEMVGPYQLLRVQPTDRAQLIAWLDQAGFQYSQQDVDAVEPYLMRGYHVVAARLAIESPIYGSTIPLAITWAGSELRLPLALSAARDPGKLTVYVAADGTYAFANATIRYSGTTGFGDSSYVTRNEIQVSAITSPDQDPVAVRQSSDIHYRETIEKTVTVRVPVKVTCDEGCCTDCNTTRRVRVDWLACAGAVTFVLRRRRRRR